MLVRFGGTAQDGDWAYGWTGIEKYQVIPVGLKDFILDFNECDKIYENIKGKRKYLPITASPKEVKEELFRMAKKERVKLDDIERVKIKLFRYISEIYFESYNAVWIDVPEYVLKKILLEKDFRLALVRLKFKDKSKDDVYIYVTEDDYLEVISGKGTKVLSIS